MTTLDELKKGALEYLKEQLEDNAEFDNGELYISIDEYDTIAEITDSSVPIHTSDLLQLAANNIYLATVEPELGPAFDGTPTPINIIAANIYEEIQNELFGELENIKENIGEKCESCGNRVADDSLIEVTEEDKSDTLMCDDCYADFQGAEDD